MIMRRQRMAGRSAGTWQWVCTRQHINCYDRPVNDCVWGLIRTAAGQCGRIWLWIPVRTICAWGNEARLNAPATWGWTGDGECRKGQLSDITIIQWENWAGSTDVWRKEEPTSETEETVSWKLSEERSAGYKCWTVSHNLNTRKL